MWPLPDVFHLGHRGGWAGMGPTAWFLCSSPHVLRAVKDTAEPACQGPRPRAAQWCGGYLRELLPTQSLKLARSRWRPAPGLCVSLGSGVLGRGPGARWMCGDFCLSASSNGHLLFLRVVLIGPYPLRTSISEGHQKQGKNREPPAGGGRGPGALPVLSFLVLICLRSVSLSLQGTLSTS